MNLNKRMDLVEHKIEKLKKEVDEIMLILSGGKSNHGRAVKCVCGYSWITTSHAKRVSCPMCGAKTMNIPLLVKSKDLEADIKKEVEYVKGKDPVTQMKKLGF